MVNYEVDQLRQALDLVRRTKGRYLWGSVVSSTFPRAQINDAFAKADRGEVTRAPIVP